MMCIKNFAHAGVLMQGSFLNLKKKGSPFQARLWTEWGQANYKHVKFLFILAIIQNPGDKKWICRWTRATLNAA